MERYSSINIQYEKQVIGVKNKYLNKTDSIRFIKTVEALIAASSKKDSVIKDSTVMTGMGKTVR